MRASASTRVFTLPVLLAVMALSGFITSGCATLRDMLEDVPTPKISFKNVKVNKLGWESADMVANFGMTNPYPIGIKVNKVNWDLKVDGKNFLNGNNTKDFTVAAKKGGTVPVPFTVTFQNLLNTISSAKGKKEVPFELGGKLNVQTPIGPIDLPLRAKGNLPVLQMPQVRFKTVTATMKSLTKMLFKIDLGVKHQNAYDLSMANFLYDLKLEGVKVASGTASKSANVPDGAEATIQLPIEVDLVSASTAVMSAITSGKVDYKIGTDLNLKTPFGTAPLPFDYSGTVKLY